MEAKNIRGAPLPPKDPTLRLESAVLKSAIYINHENISINVHKYPKKKLHLHKNSILILQKKRKNFTIPSKRKKLPPFHLLASIRAYPHAEPSKPGNSRTNKALVQSCGSFFQQILPPQVCLGQFHSVFQSRKPTWTNAKDVYRSQKCILDVLFIYGKISWLVMNILSGYNLHICDKY